jgi:hypothetical protein
MMSLIGDWHTVDWRQRPHGAPPLCGKVRGSARRADVVADERPDRRLELLETRETAFEQVARRVGAGWEIAGGREKWDRLRHGHGNGTPVSCTTRCLIFAGLPPMPVSLDGNRLPGV